MPMLIVNLILPPSYYDVNLSTDKKQILLMKENVMLSAFQEIYRYVIDASNTNMLVSSVNQKQTQRRMQSDPIPKRAQIIHLTKESVPPNRKAQESSQREKKSQGSGMVLIPPSIQQAVDVLFQPTQSQVRHDVKESASNGSRVSGSQRGVRDVNNSPPVVTPVGNSPTITPVGNTSSITPISNTPTITPVGNMPTITPVNNSPTITPVSNSPIKTPVKDPIPVVVDRCRRSKKRHDPMLLTPVKKREDSIVLSQPPSSAEAAKNSPLLDLRQSPQAAKTTHSIFTRTPSNDLSQNTNVSYASIKQQFKSLASQSPSLLSLSSSPLFPDSQSFLHSDFAGENVPSQSVAEQELTCILQKVSLETQHEE